MVFSSPTDNTGIVEQVRAMMRVDSAQWPTSRIVNSCNNYLDTITGYAIGADRRFQWDDTNHSKLPIGTTNIVSGQKDYSFLTDEQNNKIINLTAIELLDSNGTYTMLKPVDFTELNGAPDELYKTAGKPEYYDKIADNIIRLYPTPDASVTSGLKFYFQRTASYFVDTDMTKEPGVSPLLHRGFVIASAYDGALTLGLNNLGALGVEFQKEEMKMKKYFGDRNKDEVSTLRVFKQNNR